MIRTPSCHLSLLLLVAILKGVYGSRIIGGAEVYPNSIKYQASVRLLSSHFCGGVLIHPQWVVSAAHCWMPSYLIRVYLGDHNIFVKEGFEQIFTVTIVLKHYSYQPWDFDNDIMLLKLDRPAILNSRVQPAILPDPSSPPQGAGANTCTVSGWGVMSNIYELSPVLISVDVELFLNCENFYNYGHKVTDNMICAGSRSGGRDACYGDSGGPLVCNGIFEGLVSWGIGCGYPYYPGVYTKVRNYVGWIKWVIQTY